MPEMGKHLHRTTTCPLPIVHYPLPIAHCPLSITIVHLITIVHSPSHSDSVSGSLSLTLCVCLTLDYRGMCFVSFFLIHKIHTNRRPTLSTSLYLSFFLSFSYSFSLSLSVCTYLSIVIVVTHLCYLLTFSVIGRIIDMFSSKTILC